MTDTSSILTPQEHMVDESIQFKRLSAHAMIPARATDFSAGFDLYAAEDVTVIGGCGTFIVSTDIAVQLPQGTYGQVEIRSGLAAREHLYTTAGVIDMDYTGPIKVLVACSKTLTCSTIEHTSANISYTVNQYTPLPHRYTIKKGERFAQLIIKKVSYAPGVEVEEFTRAHSGHAGFGSTGKT